MKFSRRRRKGKASSNGTKVRHNGANGIAGSTCLDPKAVGILLDTLNLDLNRLADGSPQDFARLGDATIASRAFIKLLPQIEKDIDDLLEDRKTYEQFLVRTQQKGYDTQKEIDKGLLDLFLAQSGYTAHLSTLTQKQNAGLAKLNAKARSDQQLVASDLATYLQNLNRTQQKRLQKQKQAQDFQFTYQEQMEDWSERQRLWEQGNRHALRYGSAAPNPYYAQVNYSQPTGGSAMAQYQSPFGRSQSSNGVGNWAARQAGRGARAAGKAASRGASGVGKRIRRFLGF
jgi:hypothetical protein